jgi:hypothetical protein
LKQNLKRWVRPHKNWLRKYKQLSRLRLLAHPLVEPRVAVQRVALAQHLMLMWSMLNLKR